MHLNSPLFLPKRLVIFDLDGVVYRGETPIHGSVEVITRLRKRGCGIHYLTNNSALTRQSYAEKLARMGIEVDLSEIMTSAFATTLFLQRTQPPCRSALVVGGAGLCDELNAGGIHAVMAGTEGCGDSVDAVVAGIDRSFTYQRLLQAQQAILHGARFVATNTDATFPTEQGIIPGGGSIVAAIQTASGQVPIVVGKPNTFALDRILEQRGIPITQVLMVGDRLDTDIEVGHKVGIQTALVMTGVTRSTDLNGLSESQTPTAIIADLTELEELLEWALECA